MVTELEVESPRESVPLVAVPLRVKFTTRSPARRSGTGNGDVRAGVSALYALGSVAVMLTAGKSSSAIVSVCVVTLPNCAPLTLEERDDHRLARLHETVGQDRHRNRLYTSAYGKTATEPSARMKSCSRRRGSHCRSRYSQSVTAAARQACSGSEAASSCLHFHPRCCVTEAKPR